MTDIPIPDDVFVRPEILANQANDVVLIFPLRKGNDQILARRELHAALLDAFKIPLS